MTEGVMVKVLVVEDNPLAARVAKLVLEGQGCQVCWANNGEQALQKLDESFSLILLDLGLPDMDGLQVAKLIRDGDNNFSGIPIIILTAHEEEANKIDNFKQLRLNGFLSKPLTAEICEVLLNKFNKNSALQEGYFFQE